MVIDLTEFQDKIWDRIFEPIAGDVPFQTLTVQTKDKWGDGSPTLGTSTSVRGVPFNDVQNQTFVKWADTDENDMEMVVPYDTVFGVKDGYGDQFTYEGEAWFIKRKERYPYQGGNVAFTLLLAKKL